MNLMDYILNMESKKIVSSVQHINSRIIMCKEGIYKYRDDLPKWVVYVVFQLVTWCYSQENKETII